MRREQTKVFRVTFGRGGYMVVLKAPACVTFGKLSELMTD